MKILSQNRVFWIVWYKMQIYSSNFSYKTDFIKNTEWCCIIEEKSIGVREIQNLTVDSEG